MNKYSFWTLCQQYDKIEIPILQRDYAQGREDNSINTIRYNFTNYLINALCLEKAIELDFVYGAIDEEATSDVCIKNAVFIPLDGQQRLTTLFLLHWYIAAKEDRMKEARCILSKFTYETRPSAHDFCMQLIDFKYCENIVKTIKDSNWYNDSWDLDQTVEGMLRMLETFEHNEQLYQFKEDLFDRLINTDNLLVSFYFVPLRQFGLTEQLYVRMNARGKMLSEFENFKSEFYKIISYSPESLADFKDCIEYKWVNSLWQYRDKDNYTIDEPFMRYLAYITDALYHQDAERVENSSQIKYSPEQQNNNFDIYKSVYSKQENLKFLIFALNEIEDLKRLDEGILWQDKSTSISQVLNHILTDENTDITPSLILYAAIYYKFTKHSVDNFYDYIRVVRNLAENTNDKSRREWVRILKSIANLCSDDIYSLLRQSNANELMEGFYLPQRSEEILKSYIIQYFPDAKTALHAAEDHSFMRGNISSLIRASYASSTEDLLEIEINKLIYQSFRLNNFQAIYKSYIHISQDGFNLIWGDLINSTLYTQVPWGRLTYYWEYEKHDAVMQLALKYQNVGLDNNLSVTEFAINLEKEFVKKLVRKNPLLNETRNVKHQLYLYYILSTRVMNWETSDFFRGKYNFGWLAKETNYSSIFTNGIEGDHYFEHSNPIFQTYNSQFRYNLGLKPDSTPRLEIVGSGRKNKPFDWIIAWANS